VQIRRERREDLARLGLVDLGGLGVVVARRVDDDEGPLLVAEPVSLRPGRALRDGLDAVGRREERLAVPGELLVGVGRALVAAELVQERRLARARGPDDDDAPQVRPGERIVANGPRARSAVS